MLRCVLFLSRLLGRDVLRDEAALGGVVGRLADLTVRIDGDGGPQLVERLLVRRRGAAAELISWDAVRRFEAGRPVLRADAPSVPLRELGDDEILLGRDVLDTQVVDVVGQRLARVADVLLNGGGDGALEICGVEVGFRGVLRRLGLGVGPPKQDVVAWSDLHLASDRGHSVQLSAPRSAVQRLDPRGLAALISRVDVDAADDILEARGPDVAAQAVREMHPEVAARIGRRSMLHGRHFLRSRVWPHRRRLIRWRR